MVGALIIMDKLEYSCQIMRMKQHLRDKMKHQEQRNNQSLTPLNLFTHLKKYLEGLNRMV